ncbi:MAG: VanZ family protein [Planctomycetota bacterium]
MALSTQQKITKIALGLYWPTLFVAAHIPIPQSVQRAGVSDKSLHFLAYLTLVFLLWFAVSGIQRIDWRRSGPWLVLLTLIAYGIIDEILQSLVPGRSPDVMDFVADLTGVLTGLILFTILAFWPAGLLVAATVIFSVANIARINLAVLLPVTYAVFHLFAYAVFTVLWIQCTHLYTSVSAKTTKIKWLILALAVPAGLLLMVKLFAIIFGKGFTLADTIVSGGAIVTVIAVFYLNAPLCRTQDRDSGR